MSANLIQRSLEDATRPSVRLTLRFDWSLLAAVGGLVTCSLVVIDGATQNAVAGSPHYYTVRQAGACAVGAVLMILVSRIDYSRLREWKYGIYALMLGPIVLVLALGGLTRGSKRWISFPFFQYQPSEIGKLLLVLSISAFVVDRSRRLRERETTTRTMLLALVPAMLVFLQPDLGSGLVYLGIALMVLFVAGTSYRHFLGLFALAGVALALVLAVAPAVGVSVIKPYQLARLTAFLHPSQNPASQGYQQAQSEIAIGAGQRTGRGQTNDTQTRLNFLPENHTDFVFAVVGERFGFVGASLVLSLFALLIWRGLRILTLAKNLYGTLVAGGIVAMLLFQVIVNAGMTVGVMPITGVPLPLMSYGPSSVLTTFLAAGILQSIYVQGREAAANKGRISVLG